MDASYVEIKKGDVFHSKKKLQAAVQLYAKMMVQI